MDKEESGKYRKHGGMWRTVKTESEVECGGIFKERIWRRNERKVEGIM